jgi:peptidoglycan/xylan/chitin deacetylase (PgdA/CDA1 family)
MNNETISSRMAAWVRVLSGVQRWHESKVSGCAVIVYHGVSNALRNDALDTYEVTTDLLDQQIRYLKRLAEIVPLSHLLLDTNNVLRHTKRAVSLTFDDALVSQVTHAAEVVSVHKVPWSIAVPTGLVNDFGIVWTNEARLISQNLVNTKEWELECGFKITPKCLERRGKLLVSRLMHDTSSQQRRLIMNELRQRVGESTLLEKIHKEGRFLLASWSQLEEQKRNRCEFLAHGVHHLPHNATLTEEDRKTEIQEAKRMMETHLGVSPVGFAFPHGMPDAKSNALLLESGYRFAMTTRAGWFRCNAQVWEIPRFDGEYSLPIFRRHLARPR